MSAISSRHASKVAANTANQRGFALSQARDERAFYSDVLSLHGSKFCLREPLNTTPTFSEAL